MQPLRCPRLDPRSRGAIVKALSVSAARTFLRLVEGLRPGDAKKVDHAHGVFMAVAVDFLQHGSAGSLYAIAHRFEQNGDLCPDPDVEFLVIESPVDGKAVYPTAIDQVIGYRRHVEFDGRCAPTKLDRRGQADLAAFCNQWMKNIQDQQGLR